MTEVSPKGPSAQVRAADLYRPAEVGERTALRASQCPACSRACFPARTSCPACGADSTELELAGPARLRVLTGVLAQPPGSLVAAPYSVGVAEFDLAAGGICVIGLIHGPADRGDVVIPVVVAPYAGGRIFGFRREVAVPPA